jgi:hypothetical protein
VPRVQPQGVHQLVGDFGLTQSIAGSCDGSSPPDAAQCSRPYKIACTLYITVSIAADYQWPPLEIVLFLWDRPSVGQ